MESPITRVFNLSELMVAGFGVSDPVTGRGETREGSASDIDSLLKSFCRLNGRHRLSIPTAFPSRSHEKISDCGDCARRFMLLSVLMQLYFTHECRDGTLREERRAAASDKLTLQLLTLMLAVGCVTASPLAPSYHRTNRLWITGLLDTMSTHS
jgi:hypothetical protein